MNLCYLEAFNIYLIDLTQVYSVFTLMCYF